MCVGLIGASIESICKALGCRVPLMGSILRSRIKPGEVRVLNGRVPWMGSSAVPQAIEPAPRERMTLAVAF
jgi:hypothetical protein